MLLKTIFLLIILYFIFVSVRNLARAVIADSHAARIDQEQRRAYQPPPNFAQRTYQQASPPPRTTIHVREKPVRREKGEDVEDAKFRDV